MYLARKLDAHFVQVAIVFLQFSSVLHNLEKYQTRTRKAVELSELPNLCQKWTKSLKFNMTK